MCEKLRGTQDYQGRDVKIFVILIKSDNAIWSAWPPQWQHIWHLLTHSCLRYHFYKPSLLLFMCFCIATSSTVHNNMIVAAIIPYIYCCESVLCRIFELFEYSNKSFQILLFVFVFGPFLNFEYYSNIRIIASEYYEYLKLFVLYFFVDIVNFKFKSWLTKMKIKGTLFVIFILVVILLQKNGIVRFDCKILANLCENY